MSIAMLKKEFEVIDDTVDGMTHLIELAEASRDLVKLTINLWMLTNVGLRGTRSMQARLAELLSKADPNQPIDPEDQFSDHLLDDQRSVRAAINRLDKYHPITRRIDFFHRWLVRWLNGRVRKNLVAMHEIFGWMRTQIMEHDADCSPIVGSFDNADELIAALRK